MDYTRIESDAFGKTEGINSQSIVAYSPYQNVDIQRINIMLLDYLRAMLKIAGLAKSFWGEAINIAYYAIFDLYYPLSGWKCQWSRGLVNPNYHLSMYLIVLHA